MLVYLTHDLNKAAWLTLMGHPRPEAEHVHPRKGVRFTFRIAADQEDKFQQDLERFDACGLPELLDTIEKLAGQHRGYCPACGAKMTHTNPSPDPTRPQLWECPACNYSWRGERNPSVTHNQNGD